MSRLFAIVMTLAASALGVGRAAPPTARPAASAAAAAADRARPDPAVVPFGVGERSNYEVRFGALRVGSGSMEVVGTEIVRGRETYHTVFRVRGGTFFYKVDDRFESWIDMETLASLRYVQDQQEGSKDRERHYEIFPEREAFTELAKSKSKGEAPVEQKSVKQPLDDGSFIYFIRTVPLTVGQTYEFHRYFRPDRNPVRIRVLRREKVTVPAGTFNAIVVQPSIKSKGIFSENGQAQIWFSDDAQRVMLQMKSKLNFGSLNLYLTSHTPSPLAGGGAGGGGSSPSSR